MNASETAPLPAPFTQAELEEVTPIPWARALGVAGWLLALGGSAGWTLALISGR